MPLRWRCRSDLVGASPIDNKKYGQEKKCLQTNTIPHRFLHRSLIGPSSGPLFPPQSRRQFWLKIRTHLDLCKSKEDSFTSKEVCWIAADQKQTYKLAIRLNMDQKWSETASFCLCLVRVFFVMPAPAFWQTPLIPSRQLDLADLNTWTGTCTRVSGKMTRLDLQVDHI